ncbi:MAG TPA: ThiF family adenylyltransferase [Bacteroidales bacterium]|nr:ThiF family adenylyltransferase [Bacteroidales bacterium]
MDRLQRYQRNFPAVTEEEHKLLQNSKICICGCGGLGGYSIELAARIGFGYITVIDGDTFDETNLNRQLLSNEKNIGYNKAIAAKEHLQLINSTIECNAIETYLNEDNAALLIKNHDVVIDALDSIPVRFILQRACKKEKIPLIHGAVESWYGQVSTILPGDDFLDKIYGTLADQIKQTPVSTISFSPSIISSIQVSEAVKIIIKRGTLLQNKLLIVDLLQTSFMEV